MYKVYGEVLVLSWADILTTTGLFEDHHITSYEFKIFSQADPSTELTGGYHWLERGEGLYLNPYYTHNVDAGISFQLIFSLDI